MSSESAQAAPRLSEEPSTYTHVNESQKSLTDKTAVSDNEKEKRGNPKASTSSGRNIVIADNSDNDGVYPPPSRRGTGLTNRSNRSNSREMDLPPLKKRLTDLFKSERKVKREPTWKESAMACVTASWLNVLLVFVPVGWALHFAKVNDTIVFVTTFLAIIPLAKLLGFGTEEIALRVGQTLGGLLNATLGNAVELIVAIIALVKCELKVVQSSLLGSILSNLLLVLGITDPFRRIPAFRCFFAGGIKFSEQGFKDTAAQLNSSLLVISVIAILVKFHLPTATASQLPSDHLNFQIPAGYNAAFSATANEAASILSMSRGTSIILLVIYGAYLIFQLFTHQHLYMEGPTTDEDRSKPIWGLPNHTSHRAFRQARSARQPKLATVEDGEEEEEDPEEIPQLSLYAALALLVLVTVLVAFTAEFLVSSINGVTEQHPEISVEWVGLILLPIVGNAAEHVTAVSVSVHDKIDLSMGVAVGSSIQIALFVIPFMVTLAWILGKPLSLLFDPFESIVSFELTIDIGFLNANIARLKTLFLAVLITNYTIQDGKSNWLEGFLLMMVYLIIAVSFWYYPAGQTVTDQLFTCT
ncbi:Ca2+:H+ antiporter, partial [Phenoliferia sp. Uapishka_3]